MTMVAQKFKILSKRTVRGYPLVTLSNTKRGFTVPRGKQRCMENGLCNLCKFLYVFFVFAFTNNLILSTRQNFFYSIHFEIQMTDRKDNINLGKIVFVDNNQGGNLGPVWDKPVPDR